ncbi:glycoside hydrolase family 5 protein [Pluteus cervinus]|uniref:Glycoside hydrolase family 5 protein n=1 Tax=Pluteus cervinus TaxID=181527 RepID=A0ACD3BE34_9AGAR|nr:glycoside hydrolase family 5 protein [Pluteus cervinus]
MFSASLWQLVLVASSFLVVAATNPTRVSRYVEKRNNDGPPSNFVTTENGQFVVNGSAITFIGTNVYWLSVLNADEDVDNVFGNMSAAGINLVRAWAFNDVEAIPENGTWFQLISNGTLSINNGTNGLQKLDKIVQSAQDHGIYLVFSLTNNWNPTISSTVGPFQIASRTNSNSTTLPRNFLSNDYGGMDTYVRQFVKDQQHDQFYTDENIINAFKNYTTQVVSRYVNSPAIMGWELANDPRCNSTLPAGSLCTTTTVTQWHSTLAQHVKSVDPNHLVTSGNQGFFCADCPKLFQKTTPPPPPPPPQTSPAPGQRRRSIPVLTKASLLQEQRDMQKKRKRSADGIRVRGRWVASHTRRQEDVGVGPAFDGSQGVDSEDILSIPQIGFGTFQLFPDQDTYGFDDPSLSPFDNVVQIGTNWIQRQAAAGQRTGKPVSLTGFGLVTQDNAPDFVPFNSSVAPLQSDPVSATSFGVTDDQRDQAYTQWLSTGISGGLSAMLQYQWSQQGLTTQAGTTVSPVQNESGVVPISDTSGVSPNDGYGIQGVGQAEAQGVLQTASQSVARQG